MALLPLTLSVSRHTSTSLSNVGAVDEASVKSTLFERSDHTCEFCGFKSNRYQQVHFLNGNARDWRLNNLATVCIFCQLCFLLERVASMRAGTLIWLPEFSQAALNHLCRAVYVARISPGPMADSARLALDTLLMRREEAKYRIGTDDPAILSAALQDYLEDHEYKLRHPKLDGIRLLPLDRRIMREADMEFNQFPQILAYWRSKDGPFGGALPTGWNDTFQELVAAAG